MRIIHMLFFLPILMLSACSTMNSHFSCNATAKDSCLTIEEVDEMTRFADEGRFISIAKAPIQPQGNLAKNKKGESLWLAKNMRGKSWA